MKLAYHIKKAGLESDSVVSALLRRLGDSGCEIYAAASRGDLRDGTDVLLSIGGDGTLLSSARICAPAGVPVMGVNLGRMGFLSGHDPSEVVDAIVGGNYTIEERTMLKAEGLDLEWPFALNEVCVRRTDATMLGIEVKLDGMALPAYWADGMLVSTSSGSTAYNLSAGGPICVPESKVLILTPIAPHNLNLRPLVVPEESVIELSLKSRRLSDGALSLDNYSCSLAPSAKIRISKAPFSLRMVRCDKSDFLDALESRLHWGQDVRNEI